MFTTHAGNLYILLRPLISGTKPTEFTVVVAIVIVVAVAIVVVVVFAVAAVVAVIFYRQIEELSALRVKSKGTLPG